MICAAEIFPDSKSRAMAYRYSRLAPLYPALTYGHNSTRHSLRACIECPSQELGCVESQQHSSCSCIWVDRDGSHSNNQRESHGISHITDNTAPVTAPVTAAVGTRCSLLVTAPVTTLVTAFSFSISHSTVGWPHLSCSGLLLIECAWLPV